MKTKPTPETDALLLEINEGRTYKDNGPTADLARKLERERDSILAALEYVANESQRNPMESVRDICNEAFVKHKMAMFAKWSGNDDAPIKFLDCTPK